MINIVSAIRAQFALIRTALFSKAGSVESLNNDVRALRTRAAVLAESLQDRANTLENKVADMNNEIDRLDTETDEAQLLQVAMSRLLGEA
jgi:uncharacterized protein YlxW (UPF0749 family)